MTDEATDEMKAKAEGCRLAMKAALEAIQDYCGMAPTEEIVVEGIRFTVPGELKEIALGDSTLPLETRIRAVEESGWARSEAEQVCEKLFGATGDDLEGCIERIADQLTTAITRKWRIEA